MSEQPSRPPERTMWAKLPLELAGQLDVILAHERRTYSNWVRWMIQKEYTRLTKKQKDTQEENE